MGKEMEKGLVSRKDFAGPLSVLSMLFRESYHMHW